MQRLLPSFQRTCPATLRGGPAWAQAMPVAARVLLSKTILPDRRMPGRALSATQSLCKVHKGSSGSRGKRRIPVFVAATAKPSRTHRCRLPTVWTRNLVRAPGWPPATSNPATSRCFAHAAHRQGLHICEVGMVRPVLPIGRVRVRPAEITQPVTRLGSG